MKALKNLFLNELADMYDSEHRITKALPRLIQAATCEKLRQALQDHLEETESQAAQIDRVFATFDEKPRMKKCPAMVGILEEGDRSVTENKKSPAINAAIIAAAQKIEHYEIASYGTLRAWAILLGNQEAADLLEEILDQEKEADYALNELAAAKNKETLEEVEIGAGASA
jgi:ferritin-like metal-binding protein YciE